MTQTQPYYAIFHIVSVCPRLRHRSTILKSWAWLLTWEDRHENNKRRIKNTYMWWISVLLQCHRWNMLQGADAVSFQQGCTPVLRWSNLILFPISRFYDQYWNGTTSLSIVTVPLMHRNKACNFHFKNTQPSHLLLCTSVELQRTARDLKSYQIVKSMINPLIMIIIKKLNKIIQSKIPNKK